MIRSLYTEMSGQQKALLVRLLLCDIISFPIGLLLGFPYTSTIAVTANLVIYFDRGFYGNILYGSRRFMTQVIQGSIVFFIIYLCKYHLALPIHDTVLCIIACAVAITIGLPINFKYQYAPLNTSLANATFIIACGVLVNYEFLVSRLIQCAIGIAIAYVIEWVIMHRKNRYYQTIQDAWICSEDLFLSIESKYSIGIDGLMAKNLKDVQNAKALLSINLSHLIVDNGKLPWRLRVSNDCIETIKAVTGAINTLDVLRQTMDSCFDSQDEAFQSQFIASLCFYIKCHSLALLSIKNNEPFHLDSSQDVLMDCNSSEQVLLLSDLIRYAKLITLAAHILEPV